MLAAAALWACLLALTGESVPAGTPIVSITVIRHDVFDLDDPGTSARFYRAANALHVVSRERYIRSLLLIEVGDPLDTALLAESERLVRATGFLSPVTITARPAAGGAEVVVETRDQWTTEASLNVGVAGRQHKVGFALTEQNFAGWGKQVELVWRSDSERDSVTATYVDPLLFGTRWRFVGSHRTASDGTGDRLDVVYPFFALDTPRAGGLEWRRDGQTEYLWADGEKAVAGEEHLRRLRLWGGVRLDGGGDTTRRFTAGVFVDRAKFTSWSYLDGRAYPPPSSRDLTGLEVGFEQQSDRWAVVQGFRAWSRQEDVPLGPNWRVGVGVSLPALGGEARRLPFSGDVVIGRLVGRSYSWLAGGVSGRLDGGRAANVVAHVEVGTSGLGAAGWRARAAADVSRALDLERQLTLGADTGLRGWDPSRFDGTSRAVVNLEYRRRLTGEVLHLGIIGLTVFADAGRTWAPRVGRSTEGVRLDAGVGLAVEITRAAILRIVRVEVGFGDDSRGPLLLLTGASLF